MSYKTILVHVDAGRHADMRIALAAQLALRHDAHLIGIALTGVSRLFYQEGSADLMRTALAPYMDDLYRKCEDELETFKRLVSQAGVRSSEARLVDDETGAGLALSGHYADLVILGQADPDLPAPPAGDLAPYVLLACPRPLLVVPRAQPTTALGRRILVAWNGSPEAVRAVAAALPLLRAADSVDVVTLGPSAEAAEAEDANDAADLRAYLGRHGVDAALIADASAEDAGTRLLALVGDQGADLLVMGGYGRSRLREMLLGGVTRTVLAGMRVPVLLAH